MKPSFVSLNYFCNVRHFVSAAQTSQQLYAPFLAFALDRSFYDSLRDLDITIGGDLRLDVSIGVTGLNKDKIDSDDYSVLEDAFFFKINAFSLGATVRSEDIDLNFPLLQSQSDLLALKLVDGSFLVDFSIYLGSPTNLTDLFGDSATSDLVLEGTIDIVLPVVAEIAGAPFGLTVSVNDADIFAGPGPTIEYEYELCEIKDQIEGLLDGLIEQAVGTFENELQLNDVPFDVGKLTDPIITRTEEVRHNFFYQSSLLLDKESKLIPLFLCLSLFHDSFSSWKESKLTCWKELLLTATTDECFKRLQTIHPWQQDSTTRCNR